MANRSTGAYTREIWVEHAIVIRMPAHTFEGVQIAEGSHLETVKRAPSRRMAIGMTLKGIPADIRSACKVVMCKTAEDMTLDERGRYDMLSAEDRIAEARRAAERRAEAWHMADAL